MQENNTNFTSEDDFFKPKYGNDEARESQRERIFNDIISDCYTKEEFQAAWYHYLNEYLIFPFQADVLTIINNSGETAVKTIDILELAEKSLCMHDMYVKAETAGEYAYFYLHLSVLENIQGSESTRQSIADWQFWNSDSF